MKVDLLTGSIPARSSKQSIASCVNWYLEDTKGKGLSNLIAYPTPGLLDYLNISGSVVRSLLEYKDALYAVVDNSIYKISTTPTATLLGTLGTSSGRVNCVGGGDYVVWVDGNEARSYKVSTATFATISDADFPDSADSVTFIGGRFVVNNPSATSTSGQFAWSDLNDPTAWNGLNVESASTDGDALVAVFSDTKYLYLLGRKSIEFWALDATFGFLRQPGLTLAVGTASRDSVCRSTSGNAYILSQSNQGRGKISTITSDGQYQDLSDEAMHYEISSYSTISDAFSYVYEEGGHEFYVITFPTEKKTWVYDKQSGQFHQRKSYLPSISPDDPYTRSRTNCYAFFNGKHLVGDLISGNIYELSPTTYTEDGNTILREIISKPFYEDSNGISFFDAEIEMEANVALISGQGSDPEIQLRVSKNGGYSWSNWMTRSIGQLGQFFTTIRFSRLGTGKIPVFHLRLTDPIKAVILNFRADFDISNKDRRGAQ